jgi:hypothetical protein
MVATGSRKTAAARLEAQSGCASSATAMAWVAAVERDQVGGMPAAIP